MLLTNDELQAIRARANAATPGPWEWITDGTYRLVTTHSGRIHVMRFLRKGMQDAQPAFKDGWIIVPADNLDLHTHHDAQFISRSRTDIPALLAHSDHQKRALEWLAEQAAYACSHATGCPIHYQACPRRNYRCLDIEGEDWLKKSLDATKEAAHDRN